MSQCLLESKLTLLDNTKFYHILWALGGRSKKKKKNKTDLGNYVFFRVSIHQGN